MPLTPITTQKKVELYRERQRLTFQVYYLSFSNRMSTFDSYINLQNQAQINIRRGHEILLCKHSGNTSRTYTFHTYRFMVQRLCAVLSYDSLFMNQIKFLISVFIFSWQVWTINYISIHNSPSENVIQLCKLTFIVFQAFPAAVNPGHFALTCCFFKISNFKHAFALFV